MNLLLGSTVYSTSPYGESQGPVFLNSVGCIGTEETLLGCSSQFVTDLTCSSHSRDVGVKCEGKTYSTLLKAQNCNLLVLLVQ